IGCGAPSQPSFLLAVSWTRRSKGWSQRAAGAGLIADRVVLSRSGSLTEAGMPTYSIKARMSSRCVRAAMACAVPVILAGAPLIGTIARHRSVMPADGGSVLRILTVQSVLVLAALGVVAGRRGWTTASNALGLPML